MALHKTYQPLGRTKKAINLDKGIVTFTAVLRNHVSQGTEAFDKLPPLSNHAVLGYTLAKQVIAYQAIAEESKEDFLKHMAKLYDQAEAVSQA